MKKLIVLSLLLVSPKLFAQPVFPNNTLVYNDLEVPVIRIYINPDSLAYIYSHVDEEVEYHASFVYNSSEINDSITDTGFSLRGNTSRYSQKKSFQISFNAYTQGEKFHGIEKMNLNGEHNDPSITRSKICWDILSDFKCPGSRSNHVKVYINGSYYGLYISVEHIDEEFIKLRYGNNSGNLYKCLYPADLNYLGDNPDLYKLSSSGRRVYELKINEELDDYSDLARFIDILNNVSAADMHLHLDSVFNTNAFIKVLCVDILTGNWDGYSYNKNNFYLYHNMQSGKFEYLPYDLDNTFGIDWFNIDWGNRNIYSWKNESQNLPLYSKIMQNTIYRKRFTYYMKALLNQYFNTSNLYPEIDRLKEMIQQPAEADYYRTLDYGYTINDFNNSYTSTIGAHVKYGLKPFISTRYTNALAQLENTNTAPIISYVQNSQGVINQNTSVKALVEDETENLQVYLKYRINLGNFETIQMFDDGIHDDGLSGDRFYGSLIPSVNSSSKIEYYIEATDANSQKTREPVTGYYIININDNIPSLFINEFMATNSKTIADEYGEFNDWIEIYNAGNADIYLGDKYLTDNLDNPKKWKMPEITLEAKKFVVIWADDAYLTQGQMHTNFKLSASGEQIGIFDSDANDNARIDGITFGNQETDKSYGRYADAANNWFIMLSPTPGASNIYTKIDEINAKSILRIHPNPTRDYVNIELSDRENWINGIEIYSSGGKLIDKIYGIANQEFTYKLNKAQINTGFYIFRINIESKSNGKLSIYKKILVE